MTAVGCVHRCGKRVLDVARATIEKLIDDLNGGAAAETVSFALDGTAYEIDLSKKNAAGLRKALDRYISAARPQGGSRPTPRRRATPRRRTTKATDNGAKPKRDFNLVQLREWAAPTEWQSRRGVGSRRPSSSSTR